MVDVSIIIVNYNTRDVLLACITSIYEMTKAISFEIIVVDNNSSDNSVAILKEYFPDVSILLLNINIGFGKANNEGLSISDGEMAFFLNPDTILINNAIATLYHYLRQNKPAGMCGGNLFTSDHEPNVSFMPFPTIFSEIGSLFTFNSRNEIDMARHFNFHYATPIQGYISGADIMIRKELVTNNAFDPDFFMYYEDVELAYRVRAMGYEIHSVPEAQIIHLQGIAAEKKSSELNIKTKLYLVESKLKYFKKTSTLYSFLSFFYLLKWIFAYPYSLLTQKKNKITYWKHVIRVITT